MGDQNFDQPVNYGDSGYEEQPPQSGPFDLLKKNLKTIILLIVLLAVGFGLYQYFIGSIVPATINVQDFDGAGLEGSRIQLKELSGNSVFEQKNSGESNDLKIRSGEYSLTVEKPGYKTARQSISISSENDSISVKLEKISSIEFENIIVPMQIFAGQTVQAAIVLKNTGTKDETVEIVFESPDAKALELQSLTASVPAVTSIDSNFEITIPENFAIKDQKNGDVKKFTARIRHTGKKSKEISFKILPTPNIELAKVAFTGLAAGQSRKIDVKVTNHNKFDVSGIILSINLLTTDFSQNQTEAQQYLDDSKKWLEFVSPEKTTITIDKLKAGQSQTIPLIANIPLSAQKATVFGKIILSSPDLIENIESDLVLSVSIETKVQVTAALSPKTITVPYDKTKGEYSTKYNAVTIAVKNNSQIDVQNIEIEISNPTNCPTVGWIEFVDDTVFDLAKTRAKTISTNISVAPNSNGDPVQCSLEYKYEYVLDDPSNPIESGWQDIGTLTITPGPMPTTS